MGKQKQKQKSKPTCLRASSADRCRNKRFSVTSPFGSCTWGFNVQKSTKARCAVHFQICALRSLGLHRMWNVFLLKERRTGRARCSLRGHVDQQAPFCRRPRSPLTVCRSRSTFVHAGLPVDSLKFMNKKRWIKQKAKSWAKSRKGSTRSRSGHVVKQFL